MTDKKKVYRFRFRIVDPVNNHNDEELKETLRKFASMFTSNAEPYYSYQLSKPILKYIEGVTTDDIKLQTLAGLWLSTTLSSNITNKFIIEVYHKKEWTELTVNNVKKII